MGCQSSKAADSVGDQGKANERSSRREVRKKSILKKGGNGSDAVWKKNDVDPNGSGRDEVIDESLARSLHGMENGLLTQRQSLAWHRDGVPITRVYNVLEVVGQGSMGEVTVVERKKSAMASAMAAVVAEASSGNPYLPRIHDIAAPSSGCRRGSSVASTVSSSSSVSDATESTGSVRKTAPVSSETRRRYACKTVNAALMSDSELREFLNEIEILRDLDHPNIVQLFEVYSMRRKVWIVTELCEGGDLATALRTKSGGEETMAEAQVVVIMEQVLRAVAYMHQRGVSHRDIKLENIMYESPEGIPGSQHVKLIDFGLSDRFTSKSRTSARSHRPCGTVYAAAPEVLLFGRAATMQSDIWSIGVVCYVLLSGGQYPFLRSMNDLLDFDLRDALMYGQLNFDGNEVWDQRRITQAAREFLKGCLRRNPADRWSANEGLQYLQKEWIPHLESVIDTFARLPPESDSPCCLPDPSSSSCRAKLLDQCCGSSSRVSKFKSGIDCRCSVSQVSDSTRDPNDNKKKNQPHGEEESRGMSAQVHAEHGWEEECLVQQEEEEERQQQQQQQPPPSKPSVQKKTLEHSVAGMRKRARIRSAMIESMQSFGLYGDLKKTVLMTMAYTMDKRSLHELREIFTVLDSNASGTITLLELKQGLQSIQSDQSMEDETIELLFDGVDIDGSGEIDYVEFLAAVVESQGLMTLDRLADAFDRLDSTGKGYISKQDLRNVLGKDYSEGLVSRMIQEADYDRNGRVDYEEVLRLMFEDQKKDDSPATATAA